MTQAATMASQSVANAPVELERDLFLRSLLRELAGTLESVVGTAEASGYISVVGGAMGESIDQTYRHALAVDRLSRSQVRDVLIDLKRRIQGDFYIIEEREDRIVFGNRACPFGRFVEGRPSLCMMTSNVFGSIAAQNLGYARVGDSGSDREGTPRLPGRVHLRPSEDAEINAREYFRTGP